MLSGVQQEKGPGIHIVRCVLAKDGNKQEMEGPFKISIGEGKSPSVLRLAI